MSDGAGFSALLQMLPALALIVGALLLVKRWARRRGGSFGSIEGVKVISRTGLTRGAMIAIVEVGGRRYLVGAGEHGVRMLTEIDSDVIGTIGVSPAPSASPAAATESLLPSPASTGQMSRPWMGLVGRLQAMTVRSYPSRPTDALPR